MVLALEHNTNQSTSQTNSSNNSNKYLAGYYVSESKLDEESMLAYMGEHLPEYMVPKCISASRESAINNQW